MTSEGVKGRTAGHIRASSAPEYAGSHHHPEIARRKLRRIVEQQRGDTAAHAAEPDNGVAPPHFVADKAENEVEDDVGRENSAQIRSHSVVVNP